MSKFVFQTTRSIVSELGACRQVGALMGSLRCRSVMVVTDPGIVRAGLVERVQDSLHKGGLRSTIFDSIVEDPPQSLVLQAAEQAKRNGVDGVIGLGGGSPMDVAKLVAFLNGTTEQPLEDIWGVGNCIGDRLPLIQVPTTAGTGSEVTPIAIITTGGNEKKGVVAEQLYPDVALLDGELTMSVPRKTTAATGIDAMVHAIEAFTSKYKKNPMSDMLARDALRLLGANIRRVCENGDDAEARCNMLLGSCYAGMAFANAPVGAVHALAYPIGSHFHVPHGLSNSLMLPHVLRFNGSNDDAANLYGILADLAFPNRAGSFPNGADALAQSFQELATDLQVETRLSDVGIGAGDVELLATEAMKQTRLLPNNPVPVSLDDAKALYDLAL